MHATPLDLPRHRLLRRTAVGLVALFVMLLCGIQVARAATEIIPSIGISRPVDDDDAESDIYGGLAVRGHFIPMLAAEVGVAYRSEERLDGALDVRMWPVTASLYLTPIPMLYAGGGVGWYHVSLDYDDDLVPPLESETTQEFGVHLGGGVSVPMGSSLGLDLGGRYVMMREMDNKLVPEDFDPDFWVTQLGLAFRF